MNKLKFKINKLNWNVQSVPHEDERLKINNKLCFGVTNYLNLNIYLNAAQSEELFRQTVIHELVHAFSFSFGVHLVANENTEESVCDFIGSHLDEIYLLANKIMTACYKKKVK